MILGIQLGAAYGIKGGIWGKILLTTPGHLKKGQILFNDAGRPFCVSSVHFKAKGRVVLFFSGIADRTHAETFRGLSLYFPKKDLPNLEEKEFYAHTLVGCAVFTTSGTRIGHISDVANFGAGDLLEITEEKELPSHAATPSRFLVPFRDAFVHAVDRQKREIHVADDTVSLFGPEALSCASRF